MCALIDWWFSKVGYWTVTYSKGYIIPWYVMYIAYLGLNVFIYIVLRLWKRK